MVSNRSSACMPQLICSTQLQMHPVLKQPLFKKQKTFHFLMIRFQMRLLQWRIRTKSWSCIRKLRTRCTPFCPVMYFRTAQATIGKTTNLRMALTTFRKTATGQKQSKTCWTVSTARPSVQTRPSKVFSLKLSAHSVLLTFSFKGCPPAPKVQFLTLHRSEPDI